jgi:L-histidine Nalpha-methyltransferase
MPAEDRVQAHPDSYLAQLRADVCAGLTAEPKSLPPKYFYDERGSELFEEITRLPEYYPTRAETAILRARAGEIAELSRCESLVELGSGTSAKTGLLLRALRKSGTLSEFMPFDVDPAVLADATEALTTQYPGLRIVPFVGDFERDLRDIPAAKSRRMIAFLGSTIGNLEPPARASLHRNVAGVLAGGDMFLLGTDLVKDTGRLLRAYNDSAGVTAEFNRNVLKVINRELRADFDVEEFEHVAIWDAEHEWIEMRLRSVGAQVVTVGDLGLTVSLDAGEEMRTEISAKFRPAGIRAELAGAGFRTLKFWTDPGGDFGLTLAELAWASGAPCRAVEGTQEPSRSPLSSRRLLRPQDGRGACWHAAV